MWYHVLSLFVFFFKQKTAYEMRISDWSSDVCSSDLFAQHVAPGRAIMRLMEEIDQCLDDSGADAINGDNLGPGSLIVMRSRGNLGKPLDRTECLQQVTRRNRADMANATAEEETRCIRLPSRLDGGQPVFDRDRKSP